MKSKRMIAIWRSKSNWMATDNAPETKHLFGTDTLPTVWTTDTPIETVLTEIRHRNPDARVYYSEVPPLDRHENCHCFDCTDTYKHRHDEDWQ